MAGALAASGNADFDAGARGQQGEAPKVDLEREMADLASTQLRYDASAKLLSGGLSGPPHRDHATVARIFGAGAWPPRPVRSLLEPAGRERGGHGRDETCLDVISQNIANAETTRTPEGGPYKRKVVAFQRDAAGGVQASDVVEDTRPGTADYDPGHPDADAERLRPATRTSTSAPRSWT